METKFIDSIYVSNKIRTKYIITAIFLFVDLVIGFSSLLILPLTLIDYSPAALGFFLFISIGFIFLSRHRAKKLFAMEAALFYARRFDAAIQPIINIDNLEEYCPQLGLSIFARERQKQTKMHVIEDSLKRGYLVNCTIEIHDGVPKVALSKKVVVDKCPHCGAPVTDVISNVYVCKYCGSKLTDVLKKK